MLFIKSKRNITWNQMVVFWFLLPLMVFFISHFILVLLAVYTLSFLWRNYSKDDNKKGREMFWWQFFLSIIVASMLFPIGSMLVWWWWNYGHNYRSKKLFLSKQWIIWVVYLIIIISLATWTIKRHLMWNSLISNNNFKQINKNTLDDSQLDEKTIYDKIDQIDQQMKNEQLLEENDNAVNPPPEWGYYQEK